MALGSDIEWTESTWNPVTGCNKISPGCKHCYAERMAERLQAMGQPNYKDGFKLTLQPQMLELPLLWKKPQTIFVNSMSDLFHREVPLDYIQRVFEVMRRAHWHRFQVLTKRADRLTEVAGELDWAYAMTVHKAQGSEYDKVLVLLPESPMPLLTRELLYTALTRSRRSVVLCGHPDVLAFAVGNTLGRFSGLAERLA